MLSRNVWVAVQLIIREEGGKYTNPHHTHCTIVSFPQRKHACIHKERLPAHSQRSTRCKMADRGTKLRCVKCLFTGLMDLTSEDTQVTSSVSPLSSSPFSPDADSRQSRASGLTHGPAHTICVTCLELLRVAGAPRRTDGEQRQWNEPLIDLRIENICP